MGLGWLNAGMRSVSGPGWLLVVALGLMTALRLLHLGQLAENSVFFTQPMVDALEYLVEAKARATGTFEYAVPMHGPLYPALLGVAYGICQGDPFGLHLATTLVGYVTVLALYFGGRRLIGAWPAAIAALLLALYRPGLLYECEYYAAGLANLAVVVVGLLLAGWSAPERWGRVVGSGVALGVAVLIRTNLLVLLPVAWIVLWRRRSGWRAALLLTGLALLPAAAYTVHNYAVSGSFIFVQARGGQNLHMANHEAATGLVDIRPGPQFESLRRRPMVAGAFDLAAQDGFHNQQFLDFVTGQPGAFLGLILTKAWNSLSPVEAPSAYDNEANAVFSWVLRLPLPGFAWLLPLALAGLLGRAMPHAAWWRLLLVGAAVWVTMLLIYPTGRYRYQLAGLLCLFAASGLHALYRSLRGDPGSGWRMGLWVGLVGGLVLALTAPRFAEQRPRWQAEFEQLQGYAHLFVGDLAQARRHAVAADRLDSDYAWPQYLLGMVKSHGDDGKPGTAGADLKGAIECYSTAIERHADFPEAYENRAYILMQLGHLDHAFNGFEKTVELLPFRHQSWEFLAQIHRQRGQAAAAARCRQQRQVAIQRLREMPWAR